MSRPASARSQRAWDDAASDTFPDPEVPGKKIVKMDTHEVDKGGWDTFKTGVRGLWATRQTEETKTNRELYVKTTLRELVVYVVFLVILTVLTFGMTSSSMFYYTKVMSDLFLDSSFGSDSTTFRTISQSNDFWKFSETALLDGLYWDEWYNGMEVEEKDRGFIFYENKMLGVPRLRQLKVRSDSCTVHDDFTPVIHECYDVYSPPAEDRKPFGPAQILKPNGTDSDKDNMTAWYYHSEKELDGSAHWGLLASYAGGGYYQDLGLNRNATEAMIQELKQNLWISRGTRAIFLDFTVYNANINLFCVIKLAIEFPATGGAIPSWSFRTVKLIRYVTISDYFVLACEMIFTLFIFYYLIEETIEISKHKCSYFKSFWNILDVVVVAIAALCVVFSVYRYKAVDDTLTGLLEDDDKFADFEFLGFWQTQFNNVVAVVVFFAWIKTFKYITFNKTMTQLSSTLSRCSKDIGGFAVMFCIIFFAFAQLGYLVFGTQVKDFSTVGNATFTLLRIILGDFDFHALEQANRVLGPIYFCSYVFFVFFVLLNMFLAIINDTYSEVKSELAQQRNEFEIADYFKKGYQKVVGKLTNKRDQIIDIQKALEQADSNKDKVLDFDEWRRELKARGYADAEIEQVFAKYDLDGDRTLNEEEQKKMMADLEGQKDELNLEIDQVEQGKGTIEAGDEEGKPAPVLGVAQAEFDSLKRRVDRMEHSIGSLVGKIEAVLTKVEGLEKERGRITKSISSVNADPSLSDKEKRERIEKLISNDSQESQSTASTTSLGSKRG